MLVRHPDEYLQVPPCRNCGAKNYRTDAYMNKRNTSLKGMGCGCSGYWFLHRKGSKFCWHRPDGTTRTPGDDDFNDRHMSDEEIAAAAAQIIGNENVATIF